MIEEAEKVITDTERRRSDQYRILIVEDEDDIRNIFSKILTRFGYHVVVAENGEQAIDLLLGNRDLDLVITDIRMPRIDGNRLAEFIRGSDRSAIPIIAMTGFPEEVQKEFFDYSLVKPIRLESLLEIVQCFTCS